MSMRRYVRGNLILLGLLALCLGLLPGCAITRPSFSGVQKKLEEQLAKGTDRKQVEAVLDKLNNKWGFTYKKKDAKTYEVHADKLKFSSLLGDRSGDYVIKLDDHGKVSSVSAKKNKDTKQE